MKKEYVEELEKTGQVAILFNGFLYVVYESMMEEGYQVNKYDPFDIELGVIDGGLCTGTAKETLEGFLL